MSLTYEEILDSMKTAFQEEKGEAVKNLSDLELRFKAVASEIYSVCAFGEYIMKQGFPQTATGEYLEKHGALRDITRKTASHAKGELTFSLSEESAKSVTIPAGTVCSVSGKPFIQFSTDEAIEITAGELSATAKATALKSGYEYNVEEGAVTVLVNPPAYVFSVTNEKAFTGGQDAESDEALRERILSSYNSGKNGLSTSAVREMILTVDEVTDAIIYPDANYTLYVYLKTKSGSISSSLKSQVEDLLGFTAFCSVKLLFFPAYERAFYIVAEVKALSGFNSAETENAVKERIYEYCSREKIGESYSKSAVAAACGNIDGVEYVNVSFFSKGENSSYCGKNEYLKLKNVEVIIHE